MPKKITIIFLISAIVYLTFLLFLPSFSSYFFQDDWFSFLISRADSASDFLRFFVPRTDVIYYRPLGMQIPFFIVNNLFGLNELPFRVATLVIHLCNGLLVFSLINRLIHSNKFSLFASLLYLFSATHFIVFYWAATFAFVLIPTFYFSSFLLFLNNKKPLSFLVFFIGFFVNELIVTIPAIIFLFLILKKRPLKEGFVFLIPSTLYIVYRIFFVQFPTTGGYTLLNSIPELFINIRNYILWSFNWPDEIYNQFVSFFIINPEFVKNFLPTVTLVGSLTVLLFLLFFILPVIKNRTYFRKSLYKISLFGLIWFLITLSPVLIFSKHYFSYYVPIPLVGVLIVMISLFKSSFPSTSSNRYNLILTSIVIYWFITSWHTIRLNRNIHWAPQRAVQSKTFITQTKEKFPTLPSNAVILITESKKNEELKWALGEENAFKVIYNDSTIRTFYGSEADYLKENNFEQLDKTKLFALP